MIYYIKLWLLTGFISFVISLFTDYYFFRVEYKTTKEFIGYCLLGCLLGPVLFYKMLKSIWHGVSFKIKERKRKNG